MPRYFIKQHSGLSVRVFLDEINIWTNRLNKARCSPQYGKALSNPPVAWIESKAEKELFSFLPVCLQAETSGFSCLHSQTQTETYIIGSPGSGLLSLRIHVSQFLIINLFTHTHIHTHTQMVLFLWKSLTNTQINWNIKCII